MLRICIWVMIAWIFRRMSRAMRVVTRTQFYKTIKVNIKTLQELQMLPFTRKCQLGSNVSQCPLFEKRAFWDMKLPFKWYFTQFWCKIIHMVKYSILSCYSWSLIFCPCYILRLFKLWSSLSCVSGRPKLQMCWRSSKFEFSSKLSDLLTKFSNLLVWGSWKLSKA